MRPHRVTITHLAQHAERRPGPVARCDERGEERGRRHGEREQALHLGARAEPPEPRGDALLDLSSRRRGR